MRGQLCTALLLDADTDRRHHQTVLNGVVGDPIGRLRREAARGLGCARAEDVELRYVPRARGASLQERFRAAWDVAVEVTPDVIEWHPVYPLTFAVKRREAQVGRASSSTTVAEPLPSSPQRVSVLAPNGHIYAAAYWPAAADPLADLRESIANAASLCNDDGIDLRVATGALPRPATPRGTVPAQVISDAWDRGAPLIRMPSTGELVVAQYVHVPGLLPQQCCGACKWCAWRKSAAAASAASTATQATAPPVTTPPKPGLGVSLAAAARSVLGWLLPSSNDARTNTAGDAPDGDKPPYTGERGASPPLAPPLALPSEGTMIDGGDGGRSRSNSDRHGKVD